ARRIAGPAPGVRVAPLAGPAPRPRGQRGEPRAHARALRGSGLSSGWPDVLPGAVPYGRRRALRRRGRPPSHRDALCLVFPVGGRPGLLGGRPRRLARDPPRRDASDLRRTSPPSDASRPLLCADIAFFEEHTLPHIDMSPEYKGLGLSPEEHDRYYD